MKKQKSKQIPNNKDKIYQIPKTKYENENNTKNMDAILSWLTTPEHRACPEV